ncbi:MAG: type II secretion system minor pseudopilin GspJ [Pseudomonadota bacterium]|nr:type II secretion system minor pseudopilin GspJ [Pseudomonadota bacterium]
MRQSGFTLLELLIAVAVFAVLGAMAYGGLNAVLNTQAHTELAAERLEALQLTMRYLERDLGQILPRPVRNAFGDTEGELYLDAQPVLALTQAGLRNPSGLPRSSLLRISWGLEDDAIVRTVWPHLDGSQVEQTRKTRLLEEVEDLKIRVMNDKKTWVEQWPPLSVSPEKTPKALAVEITLTAAPWGEIKRIMALPR